MDKISAFQVTNVTLSGFKSFSSETKLAFGNTTVITGGNGRGKSSLADALAFAFTGFPFFGDRKLDCLHNDINPELKICVHFLDESGNQHELVRMRCKSRMTISYDGHEVRQRDLNEMFGERDIFLSIFNPLYFIEELGESGRQLLERYLPQISQEKVIEQLSAPVRTALQNMELSAPESHIKRLRENIQEMESSVIYLQGQLDMAKAQKHSQENTVSELSKQIELLRSEQKALEEKQFAGLDVSAIREELGRLRERYRNLLHTLQNSKSAIDTHCLELHRRLGERKAAVYVPKYEASIAETTGRIQELASAYKRESRLCTALTPGFQCPVCHREVTEAELSTVQAAVRISQGKILAQGREKKAQLDELREMERKARSAFERFKAKDIAALESEIAADERKSASQEKDPIFHKSEEIHKRMQQLTATLKFGRLSPEEYERLHECRESMDKALATLAAQQTVEPVSVETVEQQILSLQKKIRAGKDQLQYLACYISKRTEMMLSELRINRVAISLYDVVKSTGEIKDAFHFTYGERRYNQLSLSEKIRAGIEVSELFKRLTGRTYPTFVDNMESVDDLNNIRPTGQLIMAKCIANTDLRVRPVAPLSTAGLQAA